MAKGWNLMHLSNKCLHEFTYDCKCMTFYRCLHFPRYDRKIKYHALPKIRYYHFSFWLEWGFFLFLSWLCAGGERHDRSGLFVVRGKGKMWWADEILCVFNTGQQCNNCEKHKSLPWLLRRNIGSGSGSTQNLSQELGSQGGTTTKDVEWQDKGEIV